MGPVYAWTYSHTTLNVLDSATMKIIRVLGLLSVIATSQAQQNGPYNPLGGLAEAYRDAIILRTLRQTQEAEQNRLNAEAELRRAQAEQIRLQAQRAAASSPTPAVSDAQMQSAVNELRVRFADFDTYIPEMVRLMPEMNSAEGVISLPHFLEGMYLVAKGASFSKVARHEPSASVVLCNEPAFHVLPMDVKIRILKAVDPELRSVKDSDMETVLSEIAKKILADMAKPSK